MVFTVLEELEELVDELDAEGEEFVDVIVDALVGVIGGPGSSISCLVNSDSGNSACWIFPGCCFFHWLRLTERMAELSC